MRRTRSWVGLLLLLVWMVGCGETTPAGETATTEQTPVPDDLIAASARVSLPPAGTAPSDLPDPNSERAQLLRQYCTACHALPSPATHSATDWPVVLRRMWLRTEGVAEEYNLPVPDPRERVMIVDYLLENALVVSRSELPRGQGRDLFATNCARCHELPDPGQHSSNDWPAVVIRMRQHMVQMLGQSPPQNEVQEVILYLERASSGS
jgi:mono/diheme cytochrome c family protein